MITANGTDQVTDQVTEQVTKEFGFFQKFLQELQGDLLPLSIKVVFAIFVIIIGICIIKFLLRIIDKWLEKVAQKKDIDHVNFLEDTVKYVLYAILGIFIAEYFGVKTTSVVAILGSAGLTIGLAFQGALSNFAGGVLLLLYKPFKVGDYIVIGKANAEGTIADIGIIYTTLVVEDYRKIVVPNGAISADTIINYSINGYRFLEMEFDISYSSDVEKAKSIIANVALHDSGVDTQREVFTYVSNLSDSSVKIGLRAYVIQSDFARTKFRILENGKKELEKGGISIPFNQLDVHVVQ